MSIADKAKDLAAQLAVKAVAALPNKEDDDEVFCGSDEKFVDADEFSDFSDYDSLMVDSKEGAPE